MTYRVGPKGQVVIPKALRDQLGLAPGDEVEFSMVEGGVKLEPRRDQGSLRGSLAGFGLAAALEADRRRDRDR